MSAGRACLPEEDPGTRMFFGEFGGRYVPEMLLPALEQLEEAYFSCSDSPSFNAELSGLNRTFSGRPTPLYHAENLGRRAGNCRIHLKLESLCHTGAHKINNVLGQALLAGWMGKRTLVAETGAGQHGYAVAAVAAKLGMDCRIYMGSMDMERQHPNVYSMRLMGAEVIPVEFGGRTLKDAVNAAMKFWMENLDTCHYLLGSALGPYPYPLIVRHFQSVIGREVLQQLREADEGDPDLLLACVGGGSNALGLFHPFLEREGVEMLGVEAGGRGSGPGNNAIRFGGDALGGIVQGYRSLFLQDDDGQVLPTHSISAGLDYPGVGPELAELHARGRVSFASVRDREALEAYRVLAETEGIIPALESSHAVAMGMKVARRRNDITMVINLSGRGDKDIFIAAPEIEGDKWFSFLRREVENAAKS